MESNAKTQKRIVIIDDDEDLLYTFNRSLLQKSFLTIALTNVLDISLIIMNFKPHLILLDVKIKRADGRNVCRYIKQDLKFKNPVLLFSVNEYEEHTITGSLADGFFRKTSDHSAMIRYIEQYL